MVLVKCKACGFVIDDSKLKENCPACGVKKAAFEPFIPKIEEKRRKILQLHLHPISTHFANGFVAFILMLILFAWIFPNIQRTVIYNGIYLLGIVLPIFIVATISAGIFDGKMRFKKITTPYLKLKIVVGCLFLIISIIQMLLILFLGINNENLWVFFVMSALGFICSGILGKIGGSLLCSKMP